ncbi:MAG: hypothetical protein BGO67_10605 [Alphaproteobacteria bacterium 41-28]|nr:MAG: hypothetical protein BGO67_10605 [Alphaproteobacteria bacterium 41-28]
MLLLCSINLSFSALAIFQKSLHSLDFVMFIPLIILIIKLTIAFLVIKMYFINYITKKAIAILV